MRQDVESEIIDSDSICCYKILFQKKSLFAYLTGAVTAAQKKILDSLFGMRYSAL